MTTSRYNPFVLYDPVIIRSAVSGLTKAEDLRFVEVCAAPDPHAKKKLQHGPPKIGKGGKVKRW